MYERDLKYIKTELNYVRNGKKEATKCVIFSRRLKSEITFSFAPVCSPCPLPPPPLPAERPFDALPGQVSKRGRRLIKTMKQIERHDSSSEEERVLAVVDDQKSDPEDFPPGAPEV